MRTVHLVRHGHHAEVGRVLSGRSAIGLDGVGRAQAAWLADRFADVALTAVHASPQPRAAETAEPIARGHDLSVLAEPALAEVDFGAWAGRSFAALDNDPQWRAWNEARGRAPSPGGETMAAAVARARAFLDTVEGTPVVCVTHCDIIRGVVASYLGLELDLMLRFDCDPGSVTTLTLQDGSGRLGTLNERPRTWPIGEMT